MKVLQLVNSRPVIEKLMGYDLPINMAISLKNTLKSLDPAFEVVSKRREEVVAKYTESVTDESGKEVTRVLQGKEKEAEQAMTDLMTTDIDVEVKKVPISLLSQSGVNITTKEAIALEWLIDEDNG